jgi:DNA-3-methyladenine glycosylase II
MGRLIDRVGRLPPEPRLAGTHFGAIARAIVYQQLSGRAAETIYGRFEALFGGRSPTPVELLALSDEQLRSAGLSRAKTVYLRDLAQHVNNGTLAIDRLHELDDEAVLKALTDCKGIGVWTAQMFLMFRLGRPNVLPAHDLGIRKAVQHVYGLRHLPTPEQVLARGKVWSPYGTFAAWYLWRSLELPEAASVRRLRPKKKTKAKRGKPKTAKKNLRGSRAARKKTSRESS